MSNNQYTIYSNTQLTHNTLRVAAGNIWEEDYLDINENSMHGVTAGLWLSVKDRADLDEYVRGYPGLKLNIEKYEIVVIEVNSDNVVIEIIEK